jgi:YD repeat-containing protein
VATQSNIWFAAVPPGNVPPPTTGYYAFFVGDGTGGTTLGTYYKKDAAANVTAVVPASYTTQNAQDAVGSILTGTATVTFTYDGTGHTISATVPDSAITNAKLASMAAGTFKMRAAGSGAGAPIDGTPAQAKAALGIAYADVAGLGTAATQNSSAFDAAGAATAAQAAAIAASQPVDSDLTAIAALSTTTYGRALLTLADKAGLQSTVGYATILTDGLFQVSDYIKFNNRGIGVYNVLDYNIRPANTGAQNLAAWNTLMSNIADNSSVFFPPSPSAYQFSDVCLIPAGKHLRISGASNQKSIIQTTNATAHIFSVGDWYNEFIGLKFTSSVTRTAGAAIYSGNNVAMSVYDCDFAGMYDGIVYSGGVNAGNLALVSNCGFTATLNRAIVLDGQNANTIIEKVVADGASGVCQVGLDLVQCGSVLVSNSDFIRSVNNLRFNPASGTSAGVFSAYFLNTFFDTSSASSVLFTNTGFIQRVKFTNCWFSGSVVGCEFASTAATLPTAIDFVNCDIFGNSGRGIYAHGVQDFSVSTSRLAGNTTAGIEVAASAGSVTKFNLQNNAIGPTAGFGPNGTGVLIGAGTYGGYTITGNDVRGNSTANITDSGTVATFDLRVVTDNVGHLITGSIGNLVATAVTSGTGNTALLVARVPANAVAAGQVFRYKLLGVSSSTGTLIFRVHAGVNGSVADAQVWQSITSAAQVANQRAGYEGLLTVRAAGAAGSAQAEALGFAQAALLPTLVAAVTTPTVNTAGAWFITLAVTCSIGSFTAQQAVVEAL